MPARKCAGRDAPVLRRRSRLRLSLAEGTAGLAVAGPVRFVDEEARRLMTRRAFTRAVSPRLTECQLTHLERVPIDATKAILQHEAYERALSEAGFEIVRLPELADDPDAVFVEDTALLLDGHAVI